MSSDYGAIPRLVTDLWNKCTGFVCLFVDDLFQERDIQETEETKNTSQYRETGNPTG